MYYIYIYVKIAKLQFSDAQAMIFESNSRKPELFGLKNIFIIPSTPENTLNYRKYRRLLKKVPTRGFHMI